MSEGRTIPSLDGLRAVAIVLVITCHVQAYFPTLLPMVFIQHCGALGVNIFFVISGFLITHLLSKEADRSGGIDLKRFYTRRAYRIFPAFYAYLGVAAMVRCYHPQLFTWTSFASAATYVWNYNLRAEGWLLGHTWSLSLEEQFYLLWPVILSFLPKRGSLRFAVAVIILSPVLRVSTYVLFPSLRGHIDMMLPTHLDTMMVGCFLALASSLDAYPKLLHSLSKPTWVLVSALLLTVVIPLMEQRYRGAFYLPVGISLTSIGCGIILLYSVRNATSLLGRFLNLSWLRHVGAISYSLYLWQQLFTGEQTRMFPLNLLFIAVCAEISYWLIERPSLRIRDRMAQQPSRDNRSVLQQDLLNSGAS